MRGQSRELTVPIRIPHPIRAGQNSAVASWEQDYLKMVVALTYQVTVDQTLHKCVLPPEGNTPLILAAEKLLSC